MQVRIVFALLLGLMLVGCRQPLHEVYELENMTMTSADTDTEAALLDYNAAIAVTDEVFELEVEELDKDTARVAFYRDGQLLAEAETVEEDGYKRKSGELEVHMMPPDFDLASVTLTSPNGIWIRGKATTDGFEEGIITFRDPHRSILEQIAEAIIEEILEAVVEALIESLGGTKRTIDLSSLDVSWHFDGKVVTVEE